MDEKKLKLLSELEKIYPIHLKVMPGDDFPHYYYLYEKNLTAMHWPKEGQFLKIEDKPILSDKALQYMKEQELSIRITAHGLDSIFLLMEKLRKEKKFIPPEESTGKLASIFDSPIYNELKDIATSFLAKLGSEMSKH
jgi:hypothetical protein